MSTATLDRTTDTRPVRPAARGITPARVLTSEWVKFRTLRSTWITLASAVAAMIGIGLIVGYATSTADWSSLDPDEVLASAPLQGFLLAQLLVGVLGVLFVTGEYATGMIRSTFAAVPARLPVVGAKAAVIATIVLVATTVASFGAFFGAQLFLSPDGHGSSLGDPGALRSVVGAGLYLTLVALFGGALGWIVRSTAGAISALVGVLLILPVLVGFVPGSLGTTVTKYLPSSAGESALTAVRLPDTLAPWTGLGVFAAWVLASLIVATVAVRRRDA